MLVTVYIVNLVIFIESFSNIIKNHNSTKIFCDIKSSALLNVL